MRFIFALLAPLATFASPIASPLSLASNPELSKSIYTDDVDKDNAYITLNVHEDSAVGSYTGSSNPVNQITVYGDVSTADILDKTGGKPFSYAESNVSLAKQVIRGICCSLTVCSYELIKICIS